MNTKKWLQVIGATLMLSTLSSKGQPLEWRFDLNTFLVGALIFASSFLTWKRNRNGDD